LLSVSGGVDPADLTSVSVPLSVSLQSIHNNS
jgi:hypothetical protein